MAKEGFLGALGRFASAVVEGAPEGPRNAWLTLAPWVQDLTRSASQLWLPHLLTGIPCEVLYRDPATGIGMACPSPAIAACSVCRKPTCVNHAFVARSGQVVCFPCVKQDIDDHAPPAPRVEWPPGTRGHAPPGAGAPPPGDPPKPAPDPLLRARLAQARKVIGVKRGATLAEITQAYRELAFKHHPDRNPTKRGSDQRLQGINAAYEILKKHAEGDGANP